MRYQRGISLVEILVATAVGLFLMAGIIQLFVSTKQAYLSENAFARLQENGRFALEALARDIRMAGFLGCRTASEDVDVNMLAAGLWDAAKNMKALSQSEAAPYMNRTPFMLFGYDGDGTSGGASAEDWDGLGITDERIAGTEILQVSFATGMGADLSAAMKNRSGKLTLAANADGIGKGDHVLVTDCKNVDVFAVTNDPGKKGKKAVELEHDEKDGVNHAADLGWPYAEGARAYPFTTRVYLIRPNAAGSPSLYVYSYSEDRLDELVDNVQDVRFRYAEDTNGDGVPDSEYREAGDVENWDRVYTVQISLLVTTDDNIAGNSQPKEFFDADANPDKDRRLRAAFSTTVALRNMLL